MLTQETRRAILDAARKRFLHYGFKKTTIDEIAADAGIGKGTVYLYFDSKRDLLLASLREGVMALHAEVAGQMAAAQTTDDRLGRTSSRGAIRKS